MINLIEHLESRIEQANEEIAFDEKYGDHTMAMYSRGQKAAYECLLDDLRDGTVAPHLPSVVVDKHMANDIRTRIEADGTEFVPETFIFVTEQV